MATNPFAVNIPALPPPVPDNSMVQVGQLINLRQEAQQRALETEAVRRRLTQFEAIRQDALRKQAAQQQGVPLQSLSDGTATAPAAPVAVPSDAGVDGQGQASASVPAASPVAAASPQAQPVAQQAQPKSLLDHYDDLEEMSRLYPDAFVVAGPALTNMLKDHGEAQTRQLALQKDGWHMVSEVASAVQAADPADRPRLWTQFHGMLQASGVPGIANISPTYDPAQVQTLGTYATAAEKRTDQALEGSKQAIDLINARTAQQQAGTAARAGVREENAVDMVMTASGLRPQWRYPGLHKGQPPVPRNEQGQPLAPPNYGDVDYVVGPDGELQVVRKGVLQGGRPTAQRVQPDISNINPFAAPSATPGAPTSSAAPPATSGAPSTPATEAMRPLGGGTYTPLAQATANQRAVHEANIQRAQAVLPQATAAQTGLERLNTMVDLLHRGINEGYLAANMTNANWAKLLEQARPEDKPIIENTRAFYDLGKQFQQDTPEKQGAKVIDVEGLPSKGTLMQQIAIARKLYKDHINDYNQRIPGTGMQPITSALLQKKTMPGDVFDREYAAMSAQAKRDGKVVKSRGEFANYLEKNGYDVEKVY